MKKRDFTIKTSNSSGRKIVEIINNIDDEDDLIPHINNIDDDDDLIFQWKLRKKKKKKTEKLDPNNSFEDVIIRQRMKKLKDRLRALH